MTNTAVASPKRIQVRRGRGWRKPAGAVIVTRASRWGNPFKVGADGVPDAETAVRLYVDMLAAHPELREAIRRDLAGRDLACFCPVDAEWCHADVMLDVANGRC